MTHIWAVLILFALVIGLNMALSFRQEKNLATTYVQMRRKYPLAIGKYKRLLNSGSIVMFGIENTGRIAEARMISGYTVFSRFRPFNDLVGCNIAHLNKADLSRYPKSVRLAIANASDNYLVFATGGTPHDPLGPFARLANALPSKNPTPQEA